MTLRAAKVGFTLIELLVVISIVALLLAILLPALRSARLAGQGVQCASNQRQLLIAYSTYADDNDEYLPIWFGNSKPPSYGAPYQFYLIDTAYYLQSQDVHKCPASPDHGPVLGRQVSIGYNFHLGYWTWNTSFGGWAGPSYRAHRRQQIAQLSLFAVTADKRPPSAGKWQNTGSLVEERWNTNVESGPVSIYPRHLNEQANLGLADGHVEVVGDGTWTKFRWAVNQP